MDLARPALLDIGRLHAMAWLGSVKRNKSTDGHVAQLMTRCSALLSREGEAQGRALAAQILDGYRRLDEAQRITFLGCVAGDFGPCREAVDRAIQAYQQQPDSTTMARLGAAAQPRRRQLIERLNLAAGGTLELVKMRADALRAGVRANGLDLLDADF